MTTTMSGLASRREFVLVIVGSEKRLSPFPIPLARFVAGARLLLLGAGSDVGRCVESSWKKRSKEELFGCAGAAQAEHFAIFLQLKAMCRCF